MKKFLLIIFTIILLIIGIKVKASCNDDELNEWATKVEPIFKIESEVEYEIPTDEDSDGDFAYFLSITPYREDVVIRVSDGDGSAYGKKYGNFYGVGCYTNLDELTYTIEVYGGENSKCENELLKTLTYTVPEYNRMFRDKVCEEYTGSELCEPFTNATRDMTQEEFVKQVKKTGTKVEEEKASNLKIVELLKYLLYVLIPFVIVTLIYFLRKRNFKKKEGNK